MDLNQNYSFFEKAELNDFFGEWIVICNKKIVSHDKKLDIALKKAKDEYGNARLLVVKVPEEETMIF